MDAAVDNVRLHSGWLQQKKESHERSLMGGAYTSRWGVLRGKSLHLYADQKEKPHDLTATIQLDRCAAVAVTDSAKGNFTVDFNGRELKFKAENAGSCEEWTNVLREKMATSSPINLKVPRASQLLPRKLEAQLLAQTHFISDDLPNFVDKFAALSGGEATISHRRFRQAFKCTATEECVALDRLYAVLDREGVGGVNVSDYVMAMDLLTHGTARAKSDFAFQVYDTGGVGQVTATEMRVVTRSILDVIQKAYSGNSQNGRLTMEANPEAFDEMVESMVGAAFRSAGLDEARDALDAIQFSGLCEDHLAVLDEFIRRHAATMTGAVVDTGAPR